MYCFYYLCHEEAAIIKVGVEVLQCRVTMGGIDCVWEYSRYIYDFCFKCFQPHVHTHTHTLLRRCVFTTVVSIMFMLALLKNQNKNLKETGSWTGIEKPMTDVWNLQTFQFLSSFKKWKQSIVSLWRAFLWLYRFVRAVDLCGASVFLNVVLHCACNRVVKLTCGSYVVNCKCVYRCTVCFISLTHPTCTVASHIWSSQQASLSKRRRSFNESLKFKGREIFLTRDADACCEFLWPEMFLASSRTCDTVFYHIDILYVRMLSINVFLLCECFLSVLLH